MSVGVASVVVVVGVVVVMMVVGRTEGHGILMDPPGRSSMWRLGFDTPVNYNDNALYCGGFQNQYGLQGGRCGICGDPFQGPRDNEAGGKYATGVIGRHYTQGQTIDVIVKVTANHLGWFEFKICPNNNPQQAATQECLDRHVMQLEDGSGSKLHIGGALGNVNLKLRLPADVTCSQCVIQWRYHTGNSWGMAGGKGCMGCGDQEEFYGCADVQVSSGVPSQGSLATPSYQTIFPHTPRATTQSVGNQVTVGHNFIPPGNVATTAGPGGHQITCLAISPLWKGQAVYDRWCQSNCLEAGNCPAAICSCA